MKHILETTLLFLCTFGASAQSATNIYTATLGETNSQTAEIATDELRHILEDKSAILFDVRPFLEFSISHIPGAVNVSQKPGTSRRSTFQTWPRLGAQRMSGAPKRSESA
jgi:hypothetical protein